jgi:hypothetical protein
MLMKAVCQSEVGEVRKESAEGCYPQTGSRDDSASRGLWRNVIKRAFRSTEWSVLSEDPRFQKAVGQMHSIDEAEDVIKVGLVLLDEKFWLEQSEAA